MNPFTYKLVATFFLIACGYVNHKDKVQEQTIAASNKDSCENPDANINCCFTNMPSTISSVMTIAGKNEQGEKLVISGTMLKADGVAAYPNVVLYAYHTNSKGYYSKTGKEAGVQEWHGRLHGWCKTDNNGYYEIRSIRPAPYSSNNNPAHLHLAVKEPGDKEPYYITDMVFKDDNLVNEQYLKSINTRMGGSGVVELRLVDGTWKGNRNITLPK